MVEPDLMQWNRYFCRSQSDKVAYQHIQLPRNNQLTIKRLDLIHPYVSGNKWFKLKYNLKMAIDRGYQGVMSFGGAYSNHILAVAAASRMLGLASVGIIRGEELAHRPLNHMLMQAAEFGMKLQFVTRAAYRQRSTFEWCQSLQCRYPDYFLIPEGGTNRFAVQGCTEILSAQEKIEFDIVACAVGTGGTCAGLVESSAIYQHILGISVLQHANLSDLVQTWTSKTNWSIVDDYHFGGYAKTSAILIDFISKFEAISGIQLEPTYTGKLFYGVLDYIERHQLSEQRVLVIHSGGLQARLKPSNS